MPAPSVMAMRPAVQLEVTVGEDDASGGVDLAGGVRDQPPVAHAPPELFLAFENKLVLKMPAAPVDEILIVKCRGVEGN